MATTTEWNEAIENLMASERERLGGPPTPDEVVAYCRGELPPTEAERIQALLVYYPELIELLEVKLPSQPKARAVWPRRLAMAAMLASAFAGGLLMRAPQAPRLAGTYVLESRQARGASDRITQLAANEDTYVLQPDVPRHYSHYRVDLVRDEVLWTATYDGPDFAITIPRKAIGEGPHAVEVYGDGRLLGRFMIEVVSP